jgi:hypothetical protein
MTNRSTVYPQTELNRAIIPAYRLVSALLVPEARAINEAAQAAIERFTRPD